MPNVFVNTHSGYASILGVVAPPWHGPLLRREMIRQHYPRAWQHLQNAMRINGEMAITWNAVFDDHLVDDMVVTDHDGAGRIVVNADWPPGRRANTGPPVAS